jgi:hypothetical protein
MTAARLTPAAVVRRSRLEAVLHERRLGGVESLFVTMGPRPSLIAITLPGMPPSYRFD